MTVFAFSGMAIALACLLLGIFWFSVGLSKGHALNIEISDGGIYGESRIERWDRAFVRTAIGKRIETEFHSAGITVRPINAFILIVVVSLVTPYLLWSLLAPLFGVLGLIAGYLLLRFWIRKSQQRRNDKFVQQVPDLARVLSGATGAGLSIVTAWQIAEQEMPDPAKTEIRSVNEAVRFGRSVEEAQEIMLKRLPSRELRVLASTLTISARAGGSLVSALSNISSTLEERRELRREVASRMAEATMTGYILAGMTGVVLLLMNTLQPGTVEKMTTSTIGQVALLVSFGLTAVGVFAMRRMTKVEA